jgi:DNA-directed RNA polymerase specialized sigma24 family protein
VTTDPEDLLQSALVKVALRRRELSDGQPDAYLRTILYGDAVSWWRQQRREVSMAELPLPGEPRPNRAGPAAK